jgi:hypothetical protein
MIKNAADSKDDLVKKGSLVRENIAKHCAKGDTVSEFNPDFKSPKVLECE